MAWSICLLTQAQTRWICRSIAQSFQCWQISNDQLSIHLTLYSRRSFSSGRFREEASIFDIDFSSHRSTASIYLLLNQWNTCEHHVNICHWVRLGLLSYCWCLELWAPQRSEIQAGQQQDLHLFALAYNGMAAMVPMVPMVPWPQRSAVFLVARNAVCHAPPRCRATQRADSSICAKGCSWTAHLARCSLA